MQIHQMLQAPNANTHMSNTSTNTIDSYLHKLILKNHTDTQETEHLLQITEYLKQAIKSILNICVTANLQNQ